MPQIARTLVTCNQSDMERLRRYADVHQRSLAGEIRYAIRIYLQMCEKREPLASNGDDQGA